MIKIGISSDSENESKIDIYEQLKYEIWDDLSATNSPRESKSVESDSDSDSTDSSMGHSDDNKSNDSRINGFQETEQAGLNNGKAGLEEEDFSPDETEVWCLRFPKGCNLSTLEGAKLNFSNYSLTLQNGLVLSCSNNSQARTEVHCIFPNSSSTREIPLCGDLSYMVNRQVVTTDCSPVLISAKSTVSFPELKERHPLFGSDFEDKITSHNRKRKSVEEHASSCKKHKKKKKKKKKEDSELEN